MTRGQPVPSTIPRRIRIGSRSSANTSSSDRTRACGSTEAICMGSSKRLLQIGWDFLQPEAHVHLAVQRFCGREVAASLIGLTDTRVESAEAEVTVRYEWTHAAGLGQRQRLAVECLGVLEVRRVETHRDVAQEVHGMGREARVARSEFDRERRQATGLVHSAEQQSGPDRKSVV